VPIQIGAVIAIQGSADVRLANGEVKALSLNDIVNVGDTISATDNSQVVIHTGTHPITVKPGETLLVEPGSASEQISAAKADAQIQTETFDPNELEPTAAGQPNETAEEGIVDSGISISQLSTLQPLSLEESLLAANESDSDPQQTEKIATSFTLDDDASGDLLPTIQSQTNEQALSNIDLGKISVSEDINIERSGHLSLNAAPQTLDTQYGSLTVSDSGAWQYQLNNQLSEIQQLAAGESLEEFITITGNDSISYQLAISINGSNDSAQIDGDRKASLTEDQQFSSKGKLNINDIDFGEARFTVNSEIKTSFGSAQINGDGTWEYALNNQSSAVQGLGENDRLIDSFAATSLDGTNEIIRITINGTNDTPIFSGSNQSSFYVEDSQDAQGKLSINDADFGESVFIASQTLDGRYGTGSIDEDGNWSYRIDPQIDEVEALVSGQSIYDQFTVSSADGTAQSIIVAIKGGAEPVDITAEAMTDQALAQLDFDNDVLSSPDLYIWQASSSIAESSVEVITGFTAGTEGDKLVLSDLMIQQGDDVDLEQYLQFDVGPEGTTLHITQESANEPHDILLSGFDASLHGSSNSEIITNLINAGNLEISSIG